MSFPHYLQELVLEYTKNAKYNVHKQSFKELSQSYRSDKNIHIGHNRAEVDAYLLGRLPLTFAILEHVLSLIKFKLSEKFSCVDFGCGPATALLALNEVFSESSFSYLGIEEKTSMIEAAQFFSDYFECDSQFLQSDVKRVKNEKKDLAIASFLLNEVDDLDLFFKTLIDSAEWIVCIEPGTPDGYLRLMKLRELAIAKNKQIFAPCPHTKPCPKTKENWCHFSKRVARTKELKFLKEGSLGYEDEKFCYLILSSKDFCEHEAVIVDRPHVLNFKIQFNVCDQSGQILSKEVFKKDKENFKNIKKKDWGDFI
jgi:ribosomal protein RSM22 (predicted rRNA methylase)